VSGRAPLEAAPRSRAERAGDVLSCRVLCVRAARHRLLRRLLPKPARSLLPKPARSLLPKPARSLLPKPARRLTRRICRSGDEITRCGCPRRPGSPGASRRAISRGPRCCCPDCSGCGRPGRRRRRRSSRGSQPQRLAGDTASEGGADCAGGAAASRAGGTAAGGASRVGVAEAHRAGGAAAGHTSRAGGAAAEASAAAVLARQGRPKARRGAVQQQGACAWRGLQLGAGHAELRGRRGLVAAAAAAAVAAAAVQPSVGV